MADKELVGGFRMKDELDKQLKHMMFVAQQYPDQSVERQKALGELIKKILLSGELWQTKKDQFHQDVYADALQNLFLYFCQNIEKYNPSQGSIINWFNVLMSKRFFKEAMAEALDKSVKKVPIASDLDTIVLLTQGDSCVKKIIDLIEIDADNLFKKRHIKAYPHANFQALMRLKVVGKTWQEISDMTKIKPSTLSDFYLRCLNDFKVKIKQDLQLHEHYYG